MDIKTLGLKVGGYFAISALALAISACDDDAVDSDSDSGSSISGSYTQVSAPVGDVSGVVQDTNGNPISGATVYLGNKSTTTNSGGIYYFENVKVSQTKAREDEDGKVYQQAVSVSIVPPAGYLGATVTVWPQAQIFEYSTGVAGGSDSVTAPNTVFINGFVAEAGTAVLPALTASASGTLRNQGTEEAMAAVDLSLDVVSVNGNAQEQDIDGVTFSYATANFAVTTDANGDFTFTGLPADTVLNITSANHEIVGGATQVDTSDENGMNGLAVAAVPFEYIDDVAPYVVKVAQVVDQSATRGMLDDNASTVLTIQFSETLDSSLLDAQGTSFNSIVIRDVDANSYIAIDNTVPVISGSTLTVTLNSAIPAGHDVDVWLLKDDIQDTSGNAVAAGGSVDYDSNETSATNAQYVKLALRSFEDSNKNATQPHPTQLNEDTGGVDDLAAIQSGNNAASVAFVTFRDVDDDTAGIQQLNSADDDDGALGSDADERLSALLGAIAGTIGATGSTTVDSDHALIDFTATNASYYYITAVDELGDEVDLTALTRKEVKAGGDFNNADPSKPAKALRIDADAEGTAVTLLLGNSVAPDYVVTVTPYDDFGYAGTPDSVTLADQVAPTTILQTSYGFGGEDDGSVTSLQFGDGGEQSSVASVAPGTPYFDLTPRLLGLADGTNDGSSDDVNDIRTFEQLYKLNAKNPSPSNNATVLESEQFIDESNNIYDATAWSAFTGGSFDFARTLGVAFSEDIALTSTPPTFTAVGSASAPAGFVANNDVVIDDNGDTVNTDLVNFDLANVYDFALQENGAILDFTGAVQDIVTAPAIPNVAGESGSNPTSTNNAKVVFRDMIPPMVESAVYDGRSLTVVFDKAINTTLLTDDAVHMDLNGVDIDLSDASNYSWTSATNTLVANLGDAYGTFQTGVVFNLKQYNDVTPTLGADVSGDSVKYAHAKLDFSDIPNENGATWDDYNAVGAGNEGYFEQPQFAVTNVIETFAEVVTSSASGSTTISIIYTLDHEIDLTNVDTNGDGTLASSEIQSIFSWAQGTSPTPVGTINATGNSLTITEQADGKVQYSFLLSLSSVTAGLQTIDADFDGDGMFNGDGNDRVSLYDGSTNASTQRTLN
ncbi:MAG: carboxypeptidase-like regulatory domain-containing protein [Reinekea sp.]